MAAETRQAGLTADERSDIRSTVLNTRELIEDDLYRQLKRYGVYEDERVGLKQLGHLDSYDIETRRKINAAIDREMEATEGDYQRSLKNYVREATKTYLNRLVALKAIEVRGLVTETLMERPEYGNRSEMLRTVDEVAGELTDQQDGGQGAALKLAYTELTDEIGVIFEESEHTAIDLDFAVREEVIEQLNEIDESVWESDEAMGWVYQYFGEKEREEIDDRIDEENYKVQDTDVATKTQLFTPRYIVEWMVDNSLGRLWLEMHGQDTNIDDEDNCFYLSPLEESLTDRDAKNVRDIKVLDPACGSGHMLFYAFDVLYKMYLEQGDVAEKYIPREILKHNLYGIDIDPGAAQLAALSLYVKAKSEEPDVEIDQINIVSADAVLVNGEKKEEVLERAETDLEERVLEQVWRSFEHIREWGSLVRIEKRIEEIIDEELEEIRATGQTQFTEDGLAKQSSVVSFSGDEESWEQLKERLLSQVSELAEEALERNDPIEGMFVSEVEKSVQLLDLFIGDYDIVVSNPPYLNSAKIDTSLKNHISDNYLGNRDLYTSFIERNTELVHEDGLISMITLQGFMYLASFEDIREKVVHENSISEFVHSTELKIGSEDTSMFVLENKPADSESVFVECTSADEKQKALDESFDTRRNGVFDDNTYIIDQNSIKQIRRTPIVYHFGDEILTLFEKLSYLSDVSEITSGLATGDNDHHLRKFWEVPKQQIGEKYQWQIDNGDYNDFYDQTDYTVRWINDGENIKEYAKEHGKNYQGVTNNQPYFEEGVIFRNFSKIFTAKLMPGDCIYNKSVYHIRPSENLSNRSLLAYLNSNLYRYVAHGINPTVNFNPGDAGAVFAKSEFNNESKLRDLAQKCIDARKQQMMFEETAREFSTDIFTGCNNVEEFIVKNLHLKDQLSADIALAKSHINNLISDEFKISEKKRTELCDKYHPDITDYSNVYDRETYEVTEEEYESICRKISENIDIDIQVLSENLEVNPHSIVEIKRDSNSYAQHRKEMMVKDLLSYFLGCMLGRWENNIIRKKSDGILVFDEEFENNVNTGLRKCMKETFSDVHNTELEIENILGNGAKAWLGERFFRYHHCKEYRRRGQRIPIYWQLESEESAFSCFVYYHKMDADTFPKIRGQYIDKKLDTLQNRLEAIESEIEAADGDHARDLRSEKEEIQAEIDDVTEFRNRVDALIEEGFEPDFEPGIWENIQKVDEHDLLAVPLDKL